MKKTAFFLLLAAAFGARAEIITFDDLIDPAGGYVAVPDGYAGLDWNNIFAIHGADMYPGSGYEKGAITGQVAFTGGSTPGTISATSSQGFTLHSGYFSTPVYDEIAIATAVFEDGHSETKSFSVNADGPVFEAFGWTGLASVSFVGEDQVQVVLENLSVSVPEPAGASLALAGIAALAALARRRRARWTAA